MFDARRIGVVGQQNSGKTWLIERLIPAFAARGIRIGVIKHDGHLVVDARDDWEKSDADTVRYAQAGAQWTVLAGGGRVLWRTPDSGASDAVYLCDHLEQAARMRGITLQLIVVEGFQGSPFPKVGVARSPSDVAWLANRTDLQLKWIVCARQVASLAAPDWAVYHDTDTDRLVADIWSDADLSFQESH